MEISVVITAYNIENYVEKAVYSVLNSTFKDLEVIVINDRSTDMTLERVSAIKDPRLRIITNEINSGAGLSRRYGIQAAKGDFIMLLDGDDFIESSFIEDLVDRQHETDADIVGGGIIYIKENDDSFEAKSFGTKVSEGFEKFKDYNNGKIVFLNNKIVRRSLYDKVEYCGRRFVEDTPVIMKLLYYANKVAYVKNPGYYYLQRGSSLCHTSSKWKHSLYCALCCMELIEWFKDKEAPYNTIFTQGQFVQYLKAMQQNTPSEEELTANISEYRQCTDYLISLINIH